MAPTEAEILAEEMFFQNSQDVAVFQHYRFMPATFHEHDFFEIACVLSETFTYYIGSQQIILQTGDVFILPPHVKHAVCTYDEDRIMVNILICASTIEHHFMM